MREQTAMTESEEFEAWVGVWKDAHHGSFLPTDFDTFQAGRRSRQKQDKELCYQAERQHQNSDCKSACRICAYKIDEAP